MIDSGIAVWIIALAMPMLVMVGLWSWKYLMDIRNLFGLFVMKMIEVMKEDESDGKPDDGNSAAE